MNKKNEDIKKKTGTDKKEIKKADVKNSEKILTKENQFKKKKKIKRNITSGIAFVYSTFNNTIISISDESGNVISWSSTFLFINLLFF